jgi:NADPH-ferrihemoprotein reductase
MLASYATDAKEKETLLKISSEDPNDSEHYNQFVNVPQRTILEVLNAFPSVKPPLDHFLELLPRLIHRWYSISSSPLVHKTIHITAVVVDEVTPTGRRHIGVSSGWLSRQIPGKTVSPNENNPNLRNRKDNLSDSSTNHIPAAVEDDSLPVVPVFLRSSNFHLPPDIRIPIIMVGPGTGFAPFRGFLHHRRYQLRQYYEKNGQKKLENHTMLFFGCRSRTQDWIYREEMEGTYFVQSQSRHPPLTIRLNESKRILKKNGSSNLLS